MTKGIVYGILLLILIIGFGGWYLISPAFEVIEVDDDSPLAIRDSMLEMSDEEKAEFVEAVDAMKDEVMEMDDGMDSGARLLSQGNFMERAHEVSGRALLIESDGEKVLRFEDFETINGPNLHIYLSSGLGDADFIDLGKIKATKGNVNYEIPAGVDLEKYDKVLVWCVPFGVLFSYGELVPAN